MDGWTDGTCKKHQAGGGFPATLAGLSETMRPVIHFERTHTDFAGFLRNNENLAKGQTVENWLLKGHEAAQQRAFRWLMFFQKNSTANV